MRGRCDGAHLDYRDTLKQLVSAERSPPTKCAFAKLIFSHVRQGTESEVRVADKSSNAAPLRVARPGSQTTQRQTYLLTTAFR